MSEGRSLLGPGRRVPVIGLAVLLVVVLIGFLTPWLSPYGLTEGSSDILVGPSSAHPLGTDNLGRDVLTRSMAAARIDIGIALAGVALPLVVGTLVGAVGGTTRVRAVRKTISTVLDGVNAIPFLVLALAVIAIAGRSVTAVLLAIGVSSWARYATIARARSATLREQDFFVALTLLGYSRTRIVVRHIFPNVSREAIAYGVSDFMLVILTVASLSFLGAGVRPPTPEWGSMISDGRIYMVGAPWIVIGPGLFLTVTALAAAMISKSEVFSR